MKLNGTFKDLDFRSSHEAADVWGLCGQFIKDFQDGKRTLQKVLLNL